MGGVQEDKAEPHPEAEPQPEATQAAQVTQPTASLSKKREVDTEPVLTGGAASDEENEDVRDYTAQGISAEAANKLQMVGNKDEENMDDFDNTSNIVNKRIRAHNQLLKIL